MSSRHHIQHHLMFSDLGAIKPGQVFEIGGPEAHHAIRVKRVGTGHRVGLLDGCGRIGSGTVQAIKGPKSKPTMTIELLGIESFEPSKPRLEVYSALPKGDRLDRMIDQLSQLGVQSYRPLLCERSQRKPETVNIEKLERIAIEAAKQCHRPWLMEIGDPIGFEDAIKDPDAIVADASGEADIASVNPERVVILIGPEGGWSDDERGVIGATGVRVCRFGLFVLRIEAAACSASAIVLSRASGSENEQ
tara:strand:+ start:23210 stop:23953 length:744 start_codon:yes stop_codon:yes gene_type:complete